MVQIWNDEEPTGGFNAREVTTLPRGIENIHCPKCRGGTVTGALVTRSDGELAIESSDGQDPNLLCLECGFWWDEYRDTE